MECNFRPKIGWIRPVRSVTPHPGQSPPGSSWSFDTLPHPRLTDSQGNFPGHVVREGVPLLLLLRRGSEIWFASHLDSLYEYRELDTQDLKSCFPVPRNESDLSDVILRYQPITETYPYLFSLSRCDHFSS